MGYFLEAYMLKKRTAREPSLITRTGSSTPFILTTVSSYTFKISFISSNRLEPSTNCSSYRIFFHKIGQPLHILVINLFNEPLVYNRCIFNPFSCDFSITAPLQNFFWFECWYNCFLETRKYVSGGHTCHIFSKGQLSRNFWPGRCM